MRFFIASLVLILAAVVTVDASTCRQRVVVQHNAVVVPLVQAAIAVVPAYGAGAAYDAPDTKAIEDRLDRLEKLLQQLIDGKPSPVQVDPPANKAAATKPKLSARDEAAAGYVAFLNSNSCLKCHGQNGAKGGLVLARDGKIAKLTAEQREALVTATYFGTMPPKKFLDDNKLKPVDDQGHAAVMAAIKEGILR